MARLQVLDVVAQDTRPVVTLEFLDDDGDPVDLSVFSDIFLRVRANGVIVRAPDGIPATVVDPSSGMAEFEFQAGELIPGRHKSDIEFVEVGGAELTLPPDRAFVLNVRERV